MRLRTLALTVLVALGVGPAGVYAKGGKKGKTKKVAPAPQAERPLAEQSFEDIIRSYTFVGDFTQQPEERLVSDEIFWRYPFVLPKVDFPIKPDFEDVKTELPATRGEGRAVEHLNRGRILYLEKKYAEAKATFLGARARYGKEYPFHRRDDYFIGYSFMKIAEEELAKNNADYEALDVKSNFSNGATFLSWAFIVKADIPDPLVDAMTPKGLYNLAAIYWKYGRFAGAYGAAETGLNFLRKTGRSEYRAEFHRILAEAQIKNRSYLDAAQELDTAIRQDQKPAQAAAAFARVGDMYFDLNNYELAEDAYGLGAKIDEDMRQINPAQLVLRGESLFWLGKFSEAQKILHYALSGPNVRKPVAPLSAEYASWAALRIADAYLARKATDEAKLAYYKVGHEYRGTLAGRIAYMRSACLELPYYGGNNVKHARELLEEAKVGADMPAPGQELAWACQVGSYTDRERTPDMLNRVRGFADAYPESGFLKTFVEPVRTYQAGQIDTYFKSGDIYSAVSFFEKNRKTLFPKVPVELAQRLFEAYADVYKAASAAEFWDAYSKVPDTDLKVLRQAAVAAEMADKKTGNPWWQRNQALILELPKRSWNIKPDKVSLNYMERLRLVKTSASHLPWLHNLAMTWSQKDSDLICDLEYPLLSRMEALGGSLRQRAEKRVKTLVAQLMPELFRHDESCALSLLELEASRLRDQPQVLAKQYLARKDWPLVGGYLHLYWTISEHIYDDGDTAGAKAMWEVLRESGTPGSPEVGFAKVRLDPTKTELEKLWN